MKPDFSVKAYSARLSTKTGAVPTSIRPAAAILILVPARPFHCLASHSLGTTKVVGLSGLQTLHPLEASPQIIWPIHAPVTFLAQEVFRALVIHFNTAS